ncbi:hypothetical protein FS837_005061, partial [Tulasnella sp. UAMH 9824]
MADTSSLAHSEPNEVTALLPPDSASQRGGSKPPSYTATGHPPPSPALSFSRRSTHQPTPIPPRPIPLRRSPYSTWPIRLTLVSLIFFAFLSTAVLVVTVLNIWLPRSIAPYLPTHRGSRVLPLWFAGIATWLSLSTLTLFWTPSRATRISLKISLGVAFVDLIVLSTIPEFLHRESVLTILTCTLAIGVIGICLISNNLIQEAKEEEGKIIENRARNLREAERRAEILFLAEEQNYWLKQLWRAFKITISFLLVFFTSIILILVTINLLIRTYDSTYPLPFKNSHLHKIRPLDASYTFRVHLACTGPNTLHQPNNSAYSDALKPGPLHRVPTILYESPSKVSGTEGAEWLLDMRDRGDVGRVCLWDRPGYGFSDSSPDAEIGAIEEALWQALEKNGEKGPFLLVGEGYGGLLHRIFSARHATRIRGHVYIDAETSHTLFLSSHAHTHSTFFRSLLAPLGLHRILALPASVLSKYPSQRDINEGGTRLNRLLSPYLNPLTLATVSQEQSLSHSPSSPSFTTLLASLRYYPNDVPTIVISSTGRMSENKAWRRGQTSLWEEVTGEAGRVRWTQFAWGKDENGNEKNVWGRICADAGDEGRLVCEDA